MDLKKLIQFRIEAQRRELILPYNAKGPRYDFDLNGGQLLTRQELQVVWNLVRLARDYADSDGSGEHNALLQLVAKKSELGQEKVGWCRSYHVGVTKDSKEWKSLQSLLEESGFDMKEVYREK